MSSISQRQKRDGSPSSQRMLESVALTNAGNHRVVQRSGMSLDLVRAGRLGARSWRKFEGALFPRVKRRFCDHRVDVEGPVEVRKEVAGARPRRFIPDLGSHPRWVDPNQDEVGRAAVHRVSRKVEQLWRRQVNETVLRQHRRRIFPSRLRHPPVASVGKVDDRLLHERDGTGHSPAQAFGNVP